MKNVFPYQIMFSVFKPCLLYFDKSDRYSTCICFRVKHNVTTNDSVICNKNLSFVTGEFFALHLVGEN